MRTYIPLLLVTGRLDDGCRLDLSGISRGSSGVGSISNVSGTRKRARGIQASFFLLIYVVWDWMSTHDQEFKEISMYRQLRGI